MIKYVFVSGGVVSGLGKGITAASLGRLLKARGYHVTMQKLDPYLNVDPGTMNPIQHGEVFVTDDGSETDLDLGHYERFIDESLNHNSNVTSGKVYWTVINKERHGDYGGGTVQVIPHITNEIKSRFYNHDMHNMPGSGENNAASAGEEDLAAAARRQEDNADTIVRMEQQGIREASHINPSDVTVAIIEVGGTVGDIESQAFFEAIRQFQQEQGLFNTCMIHVTLVPYLYGSQEMKTKPTQMSVKALQQMGIRADVIVCRSEMEMPQYLKDKIALFCNVPVSHVLQNLNASSIYEVPLMMEKEHLADAVCECLDLPCPKPDLAEWETMVDNLQHPERKVEIALVGKYTQLHDAYLSVVEALHHGGIENRAEVEIRWVDSEDVEREGADALLEGIDGMIIPGGFGSRGTEGMIRAAEYARVHKIPYLGICLGMQMSMIEFARNVIGYSDANSSELDPSTAHPVIDLMPEQKSVTDLGGTMRLGAYPCVLRKDSKAYQLYGTDHISERHRHRYEVNNEYRDLYEKNGMMLSGISPNGHIVEMIELKDHPYYIGTQAHPEFKSRPNHAHPLFAGLVRAAVAYEAGKGTE